MANPVGYQSRFIGDHLVVPFPTLSAHQISDLVIADARRTGELTYPHFSVFLSSSRRFPFFTATNIDGKLFKKIPRKSIFPGGSDQWSLDTRVTDFQWGSHLYSAPRSDFQRGHMTKREDPQWGTEAEALEAARATFHFTNCVPQIGELNTQEWGKLETYILEKTSVKDNLKVCVYTGPVLADEDPVFVTEVDEKEVQLPTLFWKIVYYTEDGEHLSRAGFLMGQEKALLERGIAVRRARPAAERLAIHDRLFQDFEDAEIYQVNIKTIEQLSRIRFADAQEPYHDDRPLKLIVRKVQIAAAAAREMLSVSEDTDKEVEFANIRLHATAGGSGVRGGLVEDAAARAFGGGNGAGVRGGRVEGGSGVRGGRVEGAGPVGVGVAGQRQWVEGAGPVGFSPADARALAGEPLAVRTASAGPEQQYTREMRKRFGYHATWNPGLAIQLGDVGILKDGVFRKISDLASRGLTAPANPVAGKPIDMKYNSQDGVTITTKLSGTVTPPGSTLGQADAGISVGFHKDKSICFQANGCVTTEIRDTVALGEAILKLYEQGKWDKNWVVVTQLITAESATVLISNKAGATIDLKANANLSAKNLNIADAHFEFSAAFSHDIDTQIVAEKGLTPLFQLMGIKASWFSDPSFEPAGARALDVLTPADLKDASKKSKIQFGVIGGDDN